VKLLKKWSRKGVESHLPPWRDCLARDRAISKSSGLHLVHYPSPSTRSIMPVSAIRTVAKAQVSPKHMLTSSIVVDRL
jgi:hypothetical protein